MQGETIAVWNLGAGCYANVNLELIILIATLRPVAPWARCKRALQCIVKPW